MSLIPSRRADIHDPFSFDSWDPFFNGHTAVSGRSGISSEAEAFAKTHIDWRETSEAHVFKADLQGMRKEELKVEIENENVLKISGERRREKEEMGDTWHRLERSSGQFSRRFRLPENAKVEDVKAVIENGVLTVTVPKKQIKRRGFKNINIE